ncbi:MAG: hypothetical protein KDD33_13075 [Bdellovibrionales bacterium]|nr:hypothetical protein [Bdellovibrionales bacterium]
MERIMVNYHNFEPSHETQGDIKAQLGYNLRTGPSDASLCSCISKDGDHYSINVRVHSGTGHFQFHRESASLEKLMAFIRESMELAFAKWHADPSHFEKSHPIGHTPCRTSEHKVIDCPNHQYSNRSFEGN